MDSKETNVNGKYKDRLFTFIFGREENRDWTLSLYNAVNGSNYDDPSQIEFNTLSDVLYLGMKNDTSFIIYDIMSVYEHQSSLNPNMPLRLLEYVADLFSGYVSKKRLNKYGTSLIKLPTPRLVVFYNGEKDAEDEVILRLSNSFSEESRDKADIEVTVRMLNINYGRNEELMHYCKPLEEYAWFIDNVRTNQNGHDLQSSVKIAMDSMPKDFQIREFLCMNRQEVEGMLDKEYNEAEVRELFIEEAIAIRDKQKITEMLNDGKNPEAIADFCKYPLDQVMEIYKELRKPKISI